MLDRRSGHQRFTIEERIGRVGKVISVTAFFLDGSGAFGIWNGVEFSIFPFFNLGTGDEPLILVDGLQGR